MKALLSASLAVVVLMANNETGAAEGPAVDSLEAIAKDAVDLQNELSAILETVKTREDAEKARDKIEKIHLATKRLKTRTEKLLSDPDPHRLLAKLAVASDKTVGAAAAAEERYQAALRRLPTDVRGALQSGLVVAALPKTHEGVIDELAKIIEEMDGALGKIKTLEDVQRRRADFERMARRAKDLEVVMTKLGQPKPEDAQKMMGKAMKLMQGAMRMQEKMQKLPPEVQAELNKFSPLK